MIPVERAVQQLRDSYSSRRWDACIQAVSPLKLQLLRAESEGMKHQEATQLSREVLEIAVLASSQLLDDETFARNFVQLRALYAGSRSILPQSQNETLLIGLNLLRLLADNRIAEFHTELELIPEATQQDACLAYVVQLEQWLMEGAYNHVLSARTSPPSECFVPFLERLASTVREEVASCSERAYSSLSMTAAQSLLLIPSAEEAQSFVSERHWHVTDQRVQFMPQDDANNGDLNALEVIANSMTYARELERIV